MERAEYGMGGKIIMAKKYKAPEDKSVEELYAEIEAEFARWDYIYSYGCQDPFWADGTNLNLIRNHIIYWSRFLQDKLTGIQISLFPTDVVLKRPLPPKVPENYMAPQGQYPDRLKWRSIG